MNASRLHGGIVTLFNSPPIVSTMEIAKLEEDELQQLKQKRTAIRHYISLAYSEFLSLNSKPDEIYLKQQLSVLCQVQRKISGHFIATNSNPEGEADNHEKYCAKAREMMKPVNEPIRIKPMEIKLPTIKEKDPASWINFKATLERLAKTSISNDELLIQLISAVPTSLANRIVNLSFKDALAKVVEHYESREMLNASMCELFRNLKPMDRLLDLPALRGIRDAVADLIPLTKDESIRKDGLKKAIKLMPITMYLNWIDFNPKLEQQTLESLFLFLDARVTGVEQREAMESTPRGFKPKSFAPRQSEDKQAKRNREKGPKKFDKVHAVEEVQPETSLDSFDSSEDENKSIFELYPCIVTTQRDINRIAGKDTRDLEKGCEAKLFNNLQISKITSHFLWGFNMYGIYFCVLTFHTFWILTSNLLKVVPCAVYLWKAQEKSF